MAARRTQEERRAATIGALVEATIETLVELGYARTTVQEICRRAGVSTGALFRHFPTRQDMLVAAAEEVSRRQIAAFAERLDAVPADRRELGVVLELMRQGSRAPVNAVWFELLIAARTDTDLHAKLLPAAKRLGAAISGQAASVSLTDLPDVPPEVFATAVFTMIHVFDGEAISRIMLPLPDLEKARIPLLVELLRSWKGGQDQRTEG
jgi:AcrR family transcriptional regulator